MDKIAVIVAFALLITIVPVFAQESTGTEMQKLIETESQEFVGTDALELLTDIGIVDDTSNLDEPITQWEFNNMLSKATDTYELHNQEKENLNHLTGESMVQRIMSALGYDSYAHQLGGFPEGYWRLAAEKGLLKNTNIVANKTVTKAMAIQAIFNGLNIDIMEISSIEKDAVFRIAAGKTLLTERLKLRKARGIVTATYTTSLRGVSNLTKNQLEIDRIVYNANLENPNLYLGYTVEFYYNWEHEPLKIVHIKKKHNRTLTIQDKMVSTSPTDPTTIYNDALSRSVRLDQWATIIYNGMFYKNASNITYEDWNLDSGEIELIDNDEDQLYDVVLIREYETFIIEKPDPKKYVIADKFDAKSLVLDPTESKKKIEIYKNGMPATFMDLAEWDLVCAAISKNQDVITLLVSNQTVDGVVTALSDLEGEIDGKPYELSHYYKKLASKRKALEPGKTGRFYIDVFGRIGAMHIEFRSTVYAYLLNAAKASSVSGDVELRIFEETNNIKTILVAKRILFNGEPILAEELFNRSVFYDKDNERINKQLILFGVNDEFKINKLDTADSSNLNQSPGYNTDVFSKDYAERLMYLSYNPGLLSTASGPKYVIPKTTKIMVVPPEKNSDNEQPYYLTDNSYLVTTQYYDLEIYDADENTVPEIIVYRQDVHDLIVEDSDIVVVEKVTTTTNQDGISVYKVYGRQTNTLFEKLVSDDQEVIAKAKGIRTGDVIQIRKNANEEITNIRKVFSYEDGEAALSIPDQVADPRGSMFFGSHALVEWFSNNVLKLTDDNGKSFMLPASFRSVYRYNTKTKKIEPATLNDLTTIRTSRDKASKVFIRSRYNIASEIVIYN